MSVFITGDTHGTLDIKKFMIPRSKLPKKNDYLIICGDAAIVWDGGRHDSQVQDYWNTKPWTTLYVDGNHENHVLLNSMPVEEWHGGEVHKISDKIYHLCRGQIFDIDGNKFFTMGGADSIDKMYRIEGLSWWKEEMPTRSEYDEALNNLESEGFKVDYILTHCAPKSYVSSISPYYETDHLNSFLDNVAEYTDYRFWYCGHYHIDKQIGKLRVLYNDIIKIDSKENK